MTAYIHHINADITDSDAMLLATSHHDIIFHCAAMASVARSFENPLDCMHTNGMGTAVMLEAARRNNIRRFIFSSSAAVYGTCAVKCHEDLACQPTSPYGFSKLHGELLCQEYTRLYGLEAVSLRYFNVFSTTMSSADTMAPVYARFRHILAHNKPVTFYGSGEQTRDFVDVHDVVQANIICATAPHDLLTNNKILGNALNIASGTSLSLLELFEQLKNDFPHYNQQPVFLPARPGDIVNSSADCTKLDSLRRKAMLY